MSDISKAPWSISEVENLNRHQKCNRFHPYTCGSGKRKDDKHLDNEGILIATTEGWVCAYCDYKQNWCSSVMLEYTEKVHQNWIDDMDTLFGKYGVLPEDLSIVL